MNAMYKKKQFFLLILFYTTVALTFLGCRGYTDLSKPYVKADEVIYLTKPDSIQVMSGRNRIILKITIPADPLITKFKIVWNDGKDSIIKKIPDNNKFVSVEINNLEQGVYTFNVNSLDDEGDKSLNQTVSGRVYDKDYENFISSRSTQDVELELNSGNIIIKWDQASPQMIGTKILYKYNNKDTSLFVRNDSDKTIITDFKLGDNLKVKSLFLPDSTAIDTFYSATNIVSISNIMIPNSVYPIQHTSGEFDGNRWGNPAFWSVNSVIKEMKLGRDGKLYGGWDGLNGGGYLAMSSEDGDTFENGKIFQTHLLPKGIYNFKVKFDQQDGIMQPSSEERKQYIVVTKGNSLPNINELKNALAFSKFENQNVQFTLSEPTLISFGFVCSYTKRGEYFRVSSVALDISH